MVAANGLGGARLRYGLAVACRIVIVPMLRVTGWRERCTLCSALTFRLSIAQAQGATREMNAIAEQQTLGA